MTTAAPAQILGRHVWSELMTSDTKAAEAFYDKVVGWTSEPFAHSPKPYTQFKRSGGAGVARLMETSPVPMSTTRARRSSASAATRCRT